MDDIEWANRKSHYLLNVNIAKNKLAFSTATFILAVIINTFIIFLYPFSNSEVDFNWKANICTVAFLGLLPIYLRSKFEYRWPIILLMMSLFFANTVDGFMTLLEISCIVTKCFHIFGVVSEIGVKKPSRRSFVRNADLQFQLMHLLIAAVAFSYNPLLFSILVCREHKLFMSLK